MGKQVVKSGLVRLGGYDLTSDINSIALSLGAAALDITALNDLTKVYTPGLRDVKCAVKGFWDAANDGIIWDDISATDILSLSLSTTEGDVGFFMDSVPAQYQVTQEVGKVVAMSLTAQSAGDMIRGLILANKTGITSSGDGTDFAIGTPSS